MSASCFARANPGSTLHDMTVLMVAVAGALGVLARYAISAPFHGVALTWATVGVNVGGSFLLGVLVSSETFDENTRTVLSVGFLGGFTTFSTFSVQVFLDLEAGEPTKAFAYVCASVLLGLVAAAAGYYLGRATL
jgi:fluoride exporter